MFLSLRSLLGLALVLIGMAEGAVAAPPNIVLLFADDWRHDTLGAAAHPVVQTPHLDALARQGVRFTQARVTTSICGVSRATLLTGQWMSRHGCRAFTAFQTPWSETYPGLLRARGYWVGHVGKWHNGTFPAEKFDFARAYGGRHFLKQPDGSQLHITAQNERDALEFLRTRPAEQPFCLTLCFFAPHAEDGAPRQYLPQPASEKLYQDAQVPPPATGSDDHFRRLPKIVAHDGNEGRVRWRKRFDTPEKYQRFMRDYFRLITEVDAVCGRVVGELAEQGVLDNTLVIFTTDNGYFHGEHGLADKWYPYEESIRVPLIVRDFRLPAARRGTTDDSLVLNVDLAPTLLAAAGIAPPPRMQGRDFAPLYLAAEKPAWRTEYFYEHAVLRNAQFIPASEALVRRESKYLFWPDSGEEEYFDLTQDPHEAQNRIDNPRYAEAVKQARERFAELKAAAQ